MPVTKTKAIPRIDDFFYRDVVTFSFDAILAIDSDQKIIFMNPAAENMFGYTAADLLGKPVSTLLPERFHKDHSAHIKNFFKSGPKVRSMGDRQSHIVGQHAQGHEIHAGASIMRVECAEGYVYAAMLQDIGWRVDLMDRLSKLARLDPLTGQLNRRSFLEIAQDECKRASRQEKGLACLFFDLDRFKALNDEYGHNSGDAVLYAFAETARNCLRSFDSFCRWGGEEFVALLPNADAEGAAAAAERIRRDVEAQVFAVPGGRTIKITVSIGVAHAAGAEIDFSDQIIRADEAVYAAKAAGRNQVRIAAVTPAAAKAV